MEHCRLNDDCECIRDDELDTVNKVRHDHIRHTFYANSKTQRQREHGPSQLYSHKHHHPHHDNGKRQRHRQGSEMFTAISPELLKAALVKHGGIHKPHRPWKLDKKSLQEIYAIHAELPAEVLDGSSRSEEQLVKPVCRSPYARPEHVKPTRSKSGVHVKRDPNAKLHSKLERSLRQNLVSVSEAQKYGRTGKLESDSAGNRTARIGTEFDGEANDAERGLQNADTGRDTEGKRGSLHGTSSNPVSYEPFFITDTYVEGFSDFDEYKDGPAEPGQLKDPRADRASATDAKESQRRSRKGTQEVAKADDEAVPSSGKTSLTTLHLNDPFHQEVTMHTSDPILVSINAPPPFPAHLIDPSTTHSSNLTPLQHDARLKAIIAESKGAHIHDKRNSVRPSPAVVVPVLPVEHQVDVAPVMTAKEMEEWVKRDSLLFTIDIKQVDKHEDKVPKGKIKVEQKDERITGLDKPEEKVVADRRFKDILEEILLPNGKKWAELCRAEFPDNVMWKTDGNLASLIVTYVECCVTHGKKLSLKEMPSSIFYLRNLTILRARNNPMIVIDDHISKLKSLRYLVLSFCLFTEIPSSLFALTGLEILDVSYNLLRHMPREIMKMRYEKPNASTYFVTD
ncbi:hypothetical protein RvY_08501 [Ramazzottius varieornatus]|uniref:Uncharacterized protein n=1 Tax=Ramazzottius varieornatus TaxID=947166 RepID=A0A1D1V607_RAMVA|nr:hypothetical protein RvY_08501 [Ramazzottius varieornatus]